jgi:hypothetical protein
MGVLYSKHAAVLYLKYAVVDKLYSSYYISGML